MEREGRDDREERFVWAEGEEVDCAILIVVALLEILRKNESSSG